MKIWSANPRILFSAVLLAVPLAMHAAEAAVVITFTGTVTTVEGVGATPPAGVTVGSIVSGSVVYNTADALGYELGPAWMYDFPPASGNELTIVIGSLVWKSEHEWISVCNEACGGDSLEFLGLSMTTVNFPGNLGDGTLLLEFTDSETPFDLLHGHDLPDAAEDIQFPAALVRAGQVSSFADVSFWGILFDVDSVTVPVRTLTWGEIKALYARP